MRKMKDFSALIVILLICVSIVGGSVLAEDGEYNRSSHIASKGVFEYSNNTVVLDSSDLTYLADEIDDLERAYKSATMEALNQISTFYASTDGDISHDHDDNNVSSDTAAELSFNDLYQGILKSQSVDHLANVQAEDADSNPLYYADQSASESNNLIATTTDPNDYPLLIQPVTANNITAGTAAWVDGDLIIGNGADNKAYYDKGYEDCITNIIYDGRVAVYIGSWTRHAGDVYHYELPVSMVNPTGTMTNCMIDDWKGVGNIGSVITIKEDCYIIYQVNTVNLHPFVLLNGSTYASNNNNINGMLTADKGDIVTLGYITEGSDVYRTGSGTIIFIQR